MASWHDHILSHFGIGVAQVTLVHDPDRLVTEENVLATIVDRGYEVLLYEDPVAFRYAYEAQYRGEWDDAGGRSLAVVVQSGDDLGSLPFDVLSRGRQLSFALHDIFPALSYPVLQALDRALLDALSSGYEQHDGTRLGEGSTMEFVLLHCYGVSPRLLRAPVDLMRFLLDRHYADRLFPEALDGLLLETLQREPGLAAFPLEAIVPDRTAFYRFLQEQWGEFVARSAQSGDDCIVPFEHDSVRVYMNDLFIEGLLRPVEAKGPGELPAWVRFGIATDPERDEAERLCDLLVRVEDQLPTAQASHREWLRFAMLWAEATVVRCQLGGSSEVAMGERVAATHSAIERRFADWMMARFGQLASLPAHPQPVMVSQIARRLSYLRSQSEIGRFALVVLDGLALDQWLLLNKALGTQAGGWTFETGQAFTWVPSLTPICRQAIFAGESPVFFPGSLRTTKLDEAHWRRFWEDAGLRPMQVGYRLANLARDEGSLIASLSEPSLEAVGIVVSDIDEMVHGATLGMPGVHQQVRLWASQGHLHRLLVHLTGEGFDVFLTSDHGNIAAVGMGTPKEGVLVQSAGSRARVYPSKGLRGEAVANFPDTIEWAGAGLPPGNEVLLPRGRWAFAPQGKQIVTHGGIALEEMVVPFVRVRTGGCHEP